MFKAIAKSLSQPRKFLLSLSIERLALHSGIYFGKRTGTLFCSRGIVLALAPMGNRGFSSILKKSKIFLRFQNAEN